MNRCMLLVLFSAVLAAAQAPMTAEDALSVTQASAVIVSPGADVIAVESSGIDWRANRPTTRWTAVKGKLPFDPEGASNVVWSPDGRRVAFLRTEKDKTILYATGSGAARAVCEFYTPNAYLAATGNRLAWSPQGDRLAFTGTLEPPPAEAADPLVVDRIQYKTRTAFSDNRRSGVFVVSALPGGASPRLLSPAGRDAHSIAWGVGDEVIYLANPGSDPDANHNYDLYAVNAGSGAIRTVVSSPGVEMDPQVSPDGKWIAYRATTRAITTIDSVAEDSHVWVVPYAGGRPRELNPAARPPLQRTAVDAR